MRKIKTKPNERLAVAYIRVSTGEQSLGPEAQRAAIERWARSNGVTVVEHCEDRGVSGSTELDQRPGLLAALKAVTLHRAGLLVVAKRDRLARDVVVAAAIERLAQAKRARIVSADGAGNTDGPEGMLMRGLVDLFAQYERALIRTRTSAALAAKRARGERAGQVPFGYRLRDQGPALEADELEQKALERLRDLRAGGFPVRAIAAALNEEGVPARGQRWHATTIARLIAREVA